MFINGLPFASMVGAVLFLGERIHWYHVLAFLLTIFGIFIGTSRSKVVLFPRRQPKPAYSPSGSEGLEHLQ
jgi:drug/metabolite transporter (DMT)-like permease